MVEVETCPDCGTPMRRRGVLIDGRLVPFKHAEPYCPNPECVADGDADTTEETSS